MNPWAPFVWITALRFLREGRMQTLFIITAVGIGVAVIVFMSAMLSSLQANFLKRVLTSQPHIQLVPADEVARPLRHAENGEVVASVVQRPVQRVRSIDQWQKIRGEKVSIAAASGISRVLTITGIFDLGSKGANQRSTFVSLRTAQALLGLVGGVVLVEHEFPTQAMRQRAHELLVQIGLTQ